MFELVLFFCRKLETLKENKCQLSLANVLRQTGTLLCLGNQPWFHLYLIQTSQQHAPFLQ